MLRLACVFFEVDPLDADADDIAADLDIQPAVNAERLVVLRDLVVLRHVRIEVVLPREPAPARDRAVQRQADPDRVLDRGPVDHRQRTWQAEADRADRSVRVRAEHGRAAAEHLRRGAELDVCLEPDDGLVPGHGLVERDGPLPGHGHRPCFAAHRPASALSSPARSMPLASSRIGCPRRWSRAASTAAPTR